MQDIGFSTGALALDDFHTALDLQRTFQLTVCELSALREFELEGLLGALKSLDLSSFRYCSFHAPSSLEHLDDEQLVSLLHPVIHRKMPIVVHPDIIRDFEPWQAVGDLLLLENMDSRKRICQTSRDMQWFFEQLPDARFCFDIGHARQIDPTMSVAADLLLRFKERLAEIHISEVNWQCKHVPISSAAKWAYRSVAALIPQSTPIIIESLIPSTLSQTDRWQAIVREIATVRACLRQERIGEQQIGNASTTVSIE